MTHKLLRIILMLIVMFGVGSCASVPVRFFADTFVIVKTDAEEDFANLAAKYLKDPEKAWVIAEFNKMKTAEKGKEVVIPLDPFRLGGLSDKGCQTIPVLAFSDITRDGLMTHLETLRRLGVSVISIEQLLSFFAFDIQVPKKSVVLTFDMRLSAFEEEVLPVLKWGRYPAGLFLLPEMLLSATAPEKSFLAGLKDDKIDVGVNGRGLLHFDSIHDFDSFQSTFETHVATLERLKTAMGDIRGENPYYYASDCQENPSLMVNLLMKNGAAAAFNTGGNSNPFFTEAFNIQRIVLTGKANPDILKKKLIFFETQVF